MTPAASSNIESLLSGLTTSARAFTDSLRVHLQNQAEAPGFPPRFCSKQEIVRTMMREVEHRYGIAPGDQVERKLLRIFDPLRFEDLERWIMELLAPSAGEEEWLSLVESLTVNETYFDRDREQLGAIASEILPRLLDRKRRSGDFRLRIWSAACSSGEEAYNLAMLALLALRDSGCARERDNGSIWPSPPWNVSVLGSDISSQVIRTAKSGIYPTTEMGSFRNMDPSLWRFFEDAEDTEWPGGTRCSKQVSRCVAGITDFCRHNLLQPFPCPEAFDLILCRNVLIYFGEANKRRVQERLCHALAPGGALIFGATDPLMCRQGFTRLQRNGVFWYVKE